MAYSNDSQDITRELLVEEVRPHRPCIVVIVSNTRGKKKKFNWLTFPFTKAKRQ